MRDQAIYQTHPNVVSIEDGTIAKDAKGNIVKINKTKVDVEYKRLKLLSERKATMLRLSDAYQTSISGGVTYNGVSFQSDKNSIDNLNEVLTAISNGWVLPKGFVWIAADNSKHPADLLFLQGLAKAFADNKAKAFNILQAKKALVSTAKTIAAIRKI